MPRSQFIQLGYFYGQREVIVRSGQLGPAEAVQLHHTLAQLIHQGIRRLWLDCQQLDSVTYYGQQAILELLRQAAAAKVALYWYGFSQRVKQELAASGLYLLLHNVPLSSYRDL
jgi:anti-anti-sigma regulatory factor